MYFSSFMSRSRASSADRVLLHGGPAQEPKMEGRARVDAAGGVRGCCVGSLVVSHGIVRPVFSIGCRANEMPELQMAFKD